MNEWIFKWELDRDRYRDGDGDRGRDSERREGMKLTNSWRNNTYIFRCRWVEMMENEWLDRLYHEKKKVLVVFLIAHVRCWYSGRRVRSTVCPNLHSHCWPFVVLAVIFQPADNSISYLSPANSFSTFTNKASFLFSTTRCKKSFCSEHSQPEAHNCPCLRSTLLVYISPKFLLITVAGIRVLFVIALFQLNSQKMLI